NKITFNEVYYEEYIHSSIVYDLVNMHQFGQLISAQLRRGECQRKRSLKLSMIERFGLAASFRPSCDNCSFKKRFSNSASRVYKLVNETKTKSKLNRKVRWR